MIVFRIRGEEKVREAIRRMGEQFPSDIARGMSMATLHVQASVVRLLSNRALKRRTGNLAASINSRVEQRGRDIVGKVGTNKVYAAAQEYGATIKPMRAKFLAIPKPEGLTGTGVARYTPRQRPDMFFYVKSVTIPERPYLRRALSEQMDVVNRHIEAGVKRGVDRFNAPGSV